MSETITKTLDLKGLSCPMPIAKTALLQPGDVVQFGVIEFVYEAGESGPRRRPVGAVHEGRRRSLLPGRERIRR